MNSCPNCRHLKERLVELEAWADAMRTMVTLGQRAMHTDDPIERSRLVAEMELLGQERGR